jgi:hypothetical protein
MITRIPMGGHMPRCLFTALVAGALVVLQAESVEAQDWKDHLDRVVTAVIAPTRASGDGDRIIQYGTPLVVEKEGLSAGPSSDHVMLMNHVNDGQVRQARGFLANMTNKKNNRDYRVGERVYMTKLDVKNNEIVMFLLSSETSPIVVKGNTQQTRYKAAVRFDFPDGYLAAADSAAVLSSINAVLRVTGGDADQPPTIKLGQTTTEVEAALGKPSKVLDLGAKVIWVYDAIKVTFTDGKVSDVQ